MDEEKTENKTKEADYAQENEDAIGESVEDSDEPTSDEETKEELPCDPSTSDCDIMRDEVLKLVQESNKYERSIGHLEEIKNVLPEAEYPISLHETHKEINKIRENLLSKKKEVNDRIYDVFSRFTICTRPPKKEENQQP